MKLQIVTFEQAKVLKELGFPQEFDTVYTVKECYEDDGNYGRKHNIGDLVYSPCGLSRNEVCDAPTLELVAKWFREEKNIDLYIRPCFEKTYNGTYIKSGYTYEISLIPKECLKVYLNYEEALSIGINMVIEILRYYGNRINDN